MFEEILKIPSDEEGRRLISHRLKFLYCLTFYLMCELLFFLFLSFPSFSLAFFKKFFLIRQFLERKFSVS